jgi:hypothetical protein
MPVSKPAEHAAPAPVAPIKETTMEESKVDKRGGSAPKRYEPGEMSKKARQLDESLRRLGINAPDLLRAGKNPMENIDRLAFFKLACNLLVEEGALDREKLRQAYQTKLGWDAKTAASHLSIISSYMAAQGILAVDGKTLIRVAR